MNEISQILKAVSTGDRQASAQLLPLVYDELRRLAAQKLDRETPGQTLQPTALVHEAYVRLVAGEEGGSPDDAGGGSGPGWDSRGHFFAAAAEAMRRILVENARRKHSLKRGGGLKRRDLEMEDLAEPELAEDLLALDEALDKLAARDPVKAELVKLRYFAGMTVEEAGDVLGLSVTSVKRYWAYARAWLYEEMTAPEADPPGPTGRKKKS